MGASTTTAGSATVADATSTSSDGTSNLPTCLAWGDPHYRMWSGRWHHFQGQCEYVYAMAGGCDGLARMDEAEETVYEDREAHFAQIREQGHRVTTIE